MVFLRRQPDTYGVCGYCDGGAGYGAVGSGGSKWSEDGMNNVLAVTQWEMNVKCWWWWWQ